MTCTAADRNLAILLIFVHARAFCARLPLLVAGTAQHLPPANELDSYRVSNYPQLSSGSVLNRLPYLFTKLHTVHTYQLLRDRMGYNSYQNPHSLWIRSQMCAVPGVLSECAPSGDDAQLGLAAQRSLEGPGTQASSIHLCPKPKVNVTFISN